MTSTGATGTGLLVFGTAPTFTGPVLGTPASGVATNLTGTAAGLTAGSVTTNANLTGPVTSVGNATSMTASLTLTTPTIASFANATHNHQNAAGGGTLVDAAIAFTAPALGAPTAATIQTSGNVGVGAAPSVTAGTMLVATDNFNGSTIVRSSNPDATDTASISMVNALASTADVRLQSHGAGRVATRFGVTLANYAELAVAAGNGLLIGSTIGVPVIVGTNGTRALTVDATSQAVSLRGSQTNDSATTGDVGELISGTVAANTTSLSTGTTINVGTNTNITLTAGDWDCTGAVNFTFGATTSVSNLAGGISTTTGTLPAQDSYFDFASAAMVPTAASVSTWVAPTVRVSASGSTSVFLVTQATFSVSTVKAGGTIRCRRTR